MAKTRGASHKAYYARAAREMVAIKNRRRKLESLLKKNPENAQVAEALKNIKYRRKTPGTSMLSTNEKNIRGLVAAYHKKRQPVKVPEQSLREMYQIGTRANGGEFTWKQ